MIRQVITIDEERCDGCGECVSACHEGAIQMVDGKARLVSDRLCDGLGACLGHCPRDAIRIENREAETFDEQAVADHLRRAVTREVRALHPAGGCPSARMTTLSPRVVRTAALTPPSTPPISALGHWPVQLHLLSPTAPFLQGADLLVCATCVPIAMADFHERLLLGRAVVVACPKLDDQTGYFEKLAAMFADAGLKSVTVARMEVPCCAGLVHLAAQARQAVRSSVPLREVVVGRNGVIVREVDLATMAA